MKMTVEELGEIIAKHKRWLSDEDGGERAVLRNAVLSGADLRNAVLRNAVLSGAVLRNAVDASVAFAMTSITPEGDLIGYKKCLNGAGGYCIVKLKIPADAKRSNATGRKCRAEWAEVLEVDGAKVGISSRYGSFLYIPGEKVVPDMWNENRWEECSSGIHFFITREEAEAYDL